MPTADIEVNDVLAPTPDLVRLFDEYRGHYGQPSDPVAARAWLQQCLSSRALLAFVAERSGEAAGFALVAPTPASQRLGHFWQLRDLFVASRHRRCGVGAALLHSVHGAAARSGASRVSLVTEQDNTAALGLYAAAGFEPVTGYVSMTRSTRD